MATLDYNLSCAIQHSTACSFINLIKSLHSQQPLMAERTWFFLTHVFSCSVRVSCHSYRQNLTLTAEYLVDRSRSDCNKVSQHGIITVGLV